MFISPLARWFVSVLAWFSITSAACGGTPITVTDQKGRSIEIELIAAGEDTVTFSRKGNPKEFTLPINHFAEVSQNLIRKQAVLLPPVLPKIRPEVVIGKRRRKADSYYMMKQDISCNVKLTNLSITAAVTGIKGKVLLLGQNQRTPDALVVLSNQSFEVAIEPGKTFSKAMEPVSTMYDSDNKGYGNIGGYQYYGYILALQDKDGKFILNETATGSLRQALKENPQALGGILDYNEGKMMTDKLAPLTTAATLRIPQ